MAHTPIQHHARCTTQDPLAAGDLYIRVTRTSPLTLTVKIDERCWLCQHGERYHTATISYKHWRRSWKRSLAIWVTTWEHRQGLWEELDSPGS